jgi:hypothetical protein
MEEKAAVAGTKGRPRQLQAFAFAESKTGEADAKAGNGAML